MKNSHKLGIAVSAMGFSATVQAASAYSARLGIAGKTHMKMIFRVFAATASLGGLVAASDANAAAVINVTQVGADVVMTGTGSLNLAGTTFGGVGSPSIALRADPGFLILGSGGLVDTYTGFTPTQNFGPGTTAIFADSGAGSTFGINANSGGAAYLFLPDGYLSNGALSGSATYLNQTIASLGLTAGTYVFRSAYDSLTINIDSGATAAAPEPATWAMMLLGFGGMGYAMRRKNKVSRRIKFA